MTGPGQDATLLLVTFGAAALGGALAANLQGLGFGVGLLLVAAAAVIGAVVATLLAPGDAPARSSRHGSPPWPVREPRQYPDDGTEPYHVPRQLPPYPDQPAPPVQSAPPVPFAPPEQHAPVGDWWESTPGSSRPALPRSGGQDLAAGAVDPVPPGPAPPGAPSGGSVGRQPGQLPGGRRAPALPPPAEATVVAQCPRCGSFGLDVEEIEAGFGFRCRDCRNTWRWARDQPWPPVVVRRDLSHGPTAGRTSGTEH